MKRFLCLFLIILLTIPSIKSYAAVDLVNGKYMFSDVFDFSTWDTNQLLTSDNYRNYYFYLNGELKTGIKQNFYSYNDDSDNVDILMNTLKGDYIRNNELETSNWTGYNLEFKDLYFEPIVINGYTVPIEKCKKILALKNASNTSRLICFLIYCPSNDNVYNLSYEDSMFLTSKTMFYGQRTIYDYGSVIDPGNTDFDPYYIFKYYTTSSVSSTYTSSSSTYPDDSYHFRVSLIEDIFYSDIECHFIASDNNSICGSGCTPDYTSVITYGNALLSGSDTTGFVRDRRTGLFLDKINQTNIINVDNSDLIYSDNKIDHRLYLSSEVYGANNNHLYSMLLSIRNVLLLWFLLWLLLKLKTMIHNVNMKYMEGRK